jgi:hypothetical protein
MLAHRRHARSFSWPRTFSPLSLASCQPAGLLCARTTDAEPIIGVVGRSSYGTINVPGTAVTCSADRSPTGYKGRDCGSDQHTDMLVLYLGH